MANTLLKTSSYQQYSNTNAVSLLMGQSLILLNSILTILLTCPNNDTWLCYCKYSFLIVWFSILHLFTMFVCCLLDIQIGFEFPEYSYREEDVLINAPDQTDFPPILITKSGTLSEQTFDITVSATPGSPPATFGVDYDIGGSTTQSFTLKPEDQGFTFPFQLLDDEDPEGVERFQLQVSNQIGGTLFDPGDNTVTIVSIVDTDGRFIRVRYMIDW